MTVGELKEMLEDVPDELDVLIPMTDKFDGYWKPPCPEETGVSELGLTEDGSETQSAFVIVGHGFFDEEYGVPPELN